MCDSYDAQRGIDPRPRKRSDEGATSERSAIVGVGSNAVLDSTFASLDANDRQVMKRILISLHQHGHATRSFDQLDQAGVGKRRVVEFVAVHRTHNPAVDAASREQQHTTLGEVAAQLLDHRSM